MTIGWLEGVRTVSVGGTALAYREQGEGDAVVFVHGTAGDLRDNAGSVNEAILGFLAHYASQTPEALAGR